MSSPEFFRTIDFFPVIDMAACVRCMKCVDTCKLGVIEVVSSGESGVVLTARRHVCRNCRACVCACRHRAIKISAEMGGLDAGHLKKDVERVR